MIIRDDIHPLKTKVRLLCLNHTHFLLNLAMSNSADIKVKLGTCVFLKDLVRFLQTIFLLHFSLQDKTNSLLNLKVLTMILGKCILMIIHTYLLEAKKFLLQFSK